MAAHLLGPGNFLQNAFCHLFCLPCRFQVWQQHYKLVATEPGQGIGRANARLQSPRHRHQQTVAYLVAQGIVNRLELIQVYKQHRHQPVVLAGQGKILLQLLFKHRAVGQACQRIV